MKYKSLFTNFFVFLFLMLGALSGYILGRASQKIENVSSNFLPPLTKYLPAQTVNGITADFESYYADGLRLVFAVRITGNSDLYFPDSLAILDSSNQYINSVYGFQADTNDPTLYLIDVYIERPLEGEKFEGTLEISVYPFTSNTETNLLESAKFEFDVNVPMKPVQKINPNQKVTVNNVEMLLEKLYISPAFTQIYLCYNKPTSADWGVGGTTELIVDSQKDTLQSSGLLFDSDYGDAGKGVEANWTPPIEKGRCIKLGFPIGSENPQSITLKIPALEQPMPEIISQNELDLAHEKLLQQGIDMGWQIFDYVNGAGPVYNKLPEGMTEEEAYQKFIEALGYVHHGAWEFTIDSQNLIPIAETGSSNIVVENVVETENGYIIGGTFNSISLPNNAKAITSSEDMIITDANGKVIETSYPTRTIDNNVSHEYGVFTWAYEITGKNHTFPLTFTLKSIQIQYPEDKTNFLFNVGENPQTEQVWKINQDIVLVGQIITVDTIEKKQNGYSLLLKGSPNIISLNIDIAKNTTTTISSVIGSGEILCEITFDGEIPEGEILVTVGYLMTKLEGVWQINWQP